jgi:D-glycero-D-manno-heptose 1,7-bisphosphate phosphatase
MQPAIFLDRDGVIVENRPDYIRSWSEVRLIAGAIRALALLAGSPYKIVIVTNQSAVGRGLISQETATQINDLLVSMIHGSGGRVDGIYLCPHSPDDACTCRKPKPGLLLQAADALSLDLSRSWMIGDAWSDMQAGLQAGVQQTILLRTGRGEQQLRRPPPEPQISPLIFDNLLAAVEAILTVDNIHSTQP